MVRALAAAVALALPQTGVLVPGQSLGGLRLGSTPKLVRSSWGGFYGRCSSCAHPTLYFTYGTFQQQGAGVEFRRGGAVALFTLWQPAGWRTPKALQLGDPASKITQVYGALPRIDCGDYYALTIFSRRSVTAFYVLGDKLWGFGLMRPRVQVCR